MRAGSRRVTQLPTPAGPFPVAVPPMTVQTRLTSARDSGPSQIGDKRDPSEQRDEEGTSPRLAPLLAKHQHALPDEGVRRQAADKDLPTV
jgi:hypothetical protein